MTTHLILLLVLFVKNYFTGNEKELVKQRIEIENNVLLIESPNYKNKISRYIGGHGISFDIKFSDKAEIFYNADKALGTPTTVFYNSIIYRPLLGTIPNNTTIGGEQPNGKYCKEKIFNENSIGYINVLRSKKTVFDKSLGTFKEKK